MFCRHALSLLKVWVNWMVLLNHAESNATFQLDSVAHSWGWALPTLQCRWKQPIEASGLSCILQRETLLLTFLGNANAESRRPFLESHTTSPPGEHNWAPMSCHILLHMFPMQFGYAMVPVRWFCGEAHAFPSRDRGSTNFCGPGLMSHVIFFFQWTCYGQSNDCGVPTQKIRVHM